MSMIYSQLQVHSYTDNTVHKVPQFRASTTSTTPFTSTWTRRRRRRRRRRRHSYTATVECIPCFSSSFVVSFIHSSSNQNADDKSPFSLVLAHCLSSHQS